MERTEIGDLGEFGLIEHLTRNIEIQNVSTILGVGDDAAVIDHYGKQTIVTTVLRFVPNPLLILSISLKLWRKNWMSHSFSLNLLRPIIQRFQKK